MVSDKYPDFIKNTASFFTELSNNNNKEWFEANRVRFMAEVFAPVEALINYLGEKLIIIEPNLIAIPKFDKSVFRLHRDVRFSENKNPYKTNIAGFMWEGKKVKMEASGFYFHIEPETAFIGCGIYMFTPEVLKKYRELISVQHEAEILHKLIGEIVSDGKTKVEGKTFKKGPRNYQVTHTYPELLLHSGLYTSVEYSTSDEEFRADYDRIILEDFFNSSPLHRWLADNL